MSASPSSVISLGLGSWGSTSLILTLGYGSAATVSTGDGIFECIGFEQVGFETNCPTDTVKTRPSGGFPAYDRGSQTPEQRRRSRILHGLEREIVSDVAARQAEALTTDAAKQQQELAGELRLRGIEMRSDHLQALADERQARIDAEIGRLLRVIEINNNNNAIILLMIASTIHH